MSAIQQMLAAFEDVQYIPTPAATPAIGDAFEGGFYAGMIWNELVQSTASTVIGTGEKTFPVSITGPVAYLGQTLEVRSRANPANKMVGVVTQATSLKLVLNIASVGGSGTFADWSIMAQYRVIVAPKASGENASIKYKNANTSSPADCITVSEGRKATLAMVAAGDATVYPAAHWCNNLGIAGKADWYLPARDELELCWRNLKPGTENNYTTARGDSALSYKTFGSFDDAGTGQGTNLNSNPSGAAYTTTVPARTAVTDFRTGGAEAFAYSANTYWSASEYSSAAAWLQNWSTSGPGAQSNASKTISYYVRAVRRSII